jgi:hypothetical protein
VSALLSEVAGEVELEVSTLHAISSLASELQSSKLVQVRESGTHTTWCVHGVWSCHSPTPTFGASQVCSVLCSYIEANVRRPSPA